MPRMAPETHALLEAAVHAVPISVLTHVGEKVEARRGPASTYRHNVLFLRLQGAPCSASAPLAQIWGCG